MFKKAFGYFFLSLMLLAAPASAFAAAAKDVKCKGCVQAKDIAKNAVTSSKVKNGSISSAKLNSSLKSALGVAGSTTVDCDNGGSVTAALAAGYTEITVRGTCSESVTIDRDGVSLSAHGSGGSIISPVADPAIYVDGAARVVVSDLTLGGLEDGVEIEGGAYVALESVTIDSAAGDGVSVDSNSAVYIDDATITNNTGDGIDISTSSYAEIVNSTITGNGDYGILVTVGSAVEVGFSGEGNTISSNGKEGIRVQQNSVATLTANTISNHLSGSGVGVYTQSSVELVNGNNITGNSNYGIAVGGSALNQWGNSGSSIASNAGGIWLNDARLYFTIGTVSGGTGNGIDANGNSSMTITGTASLTDGVNCVTSRPYIVTTVGVNVDSVTTCSNPG